MREEYPVKRLTKRDGGFTLIELLVVIAIIAILAAILFPVFARAREGGRRSACLSNTKQMAVAAHMYLETWDGIYPTSSVYPNPPNMANYGFGFWMGLLQPYLKTYDVFRCPSAPHDKPVWLPDNSPYKVANYGYNEYIVFSVDRDYSNETNLKNLSQTALIADCFNAALFHDWGNAEDANTDWKNAPDKKNLPSGILRIKYANGQAGGRVLVRRHEGSNIVYADAHAGFMPVNRFDMKTEKGVIYERPIIFPDAKPFP